MRKVRRCLGRGASVIQNATLYPIPNSSGRPWVGNTFQLRNSEVTWTPENYCNRQGNTVLGNFLDMILRDVGDPLTIVNRVSTSNGQTDREYQLRNGAIPSGVNKPSAG